MSNNISAFSDEHKSKLEEIQKKLKGLSEKDRDALLELAQKAHGEDNNELLFLIGTAFQDGEGVEQDHGEALRLYKEAAALGNSSAEVRIAQYYLFGIHVAKDYEEAFKWYSRAAAQGSSTAQANLAIMLKNGVGVEKDPEAACEWARRAAEQGNATAQFILGHSYRFGDGIEKDESAAVFWFEKAAAQGNAQAKTSLAHMLMLGGEIEKESKRAAQLYREAAEAGDAEAQWQIATFPPTLDGFDDIDDEERVEWLRKSAEQGYKFAQRDLGVRYLKSEGVAKNRKKAEGLLLKAAEQGHGQAMYDLFEFYLDEDNPYRSREKAVHWLHEAAKSSSSIMSFEAQVKLAEAYEGGKWGLPVDKEEAFWYWTEANAHLYVSLVPKKEHAYVVYKIAQAYEKGEGTSLSPEEAVSWYDYAAELGHPEAGEAMKRALRKAEELDTRAEELHTRAEELDTRVERPGDAVTLTTQISADGFHIRWKKRGYGSARLLGFRREGGFPPDNAKEHEYGTRILIADKESGEETDQGVEGGKTYYYTFVLKEKNPDYKRVPGILEQISRTIGGQGEINSADEFLYTLCHSFQVKIPQDMLSELAAQRDIASREYELLRAQSRLEKGRKFPRTEEERAREELKRKFVPEKVRRETTLYLDEQQRKELQAARDAFARGEYDDEDEYLHAVTDIKDYYVTLKAKL